MGTVEYSWHVLAVRNLQASVQYFIDQLAFEEVRRTPNGKAFLKFDNFRIILGECPEEIEAKAIGDHSYFAYIVCKDIETLYKGLRSRQAIISSPLSSKSWGMKEFNIDTPDGHRMVFGEEMSN